MKIFQYIELLKKAEEALTLINEDIGSGTEIDMLIGGQIANALRGAESAKLLLIDRNQVNIEESTQYKVIYKNDLGSCSVRGLRNAYEKIAELFKLDASTLLVNKIEEPSTYEIWDKEGEKALALIIEEVA